MSYKKYEDFKFWFVYDGIDHWNVINFETQDIICDISNSGTIKESDMNISIFDHDYSQISEDFKEFKNRPEYFVGRECDINGVSVEFAKDTYKNLLTGLIFIRAYKNGMNPDHHIDYVQRILDWVESTDFYEAPASTIYHESFLHGLLYHTLTVYNNMVQLYQIPKFFKKVDIDSTALCCLVHDWCKIGLYEPYKRNVKNDKTGQWERVDAYRRRSFPHVFGHGATSMYMVMKLFKLTEEEALGIRWHMGRWNVSENEVNEFQQACEQYPLVHLIQFADQLAITDY